MMTEPRIRLSPPEESAPRRSRIPTLRARRWKSPHELTVENGTGRASLASVPPRAVGDASSLRAGEGLLSLRLKPAVTVFMTQRAYVRCCVHAGSDLDNEVGGALVGRRRVDTATGDPFIVIEGVLPARHTRQGSVYLTFTQNSLVALHAELEARYPGKELVGWYHTHPRMGVFLSGYDLWLHEHFFPRPWQVALVIEPHAGLGGFFIRRQDGRLDPQRYFGFYELVKDSRGSVMLWSNLEQEEVNETKVGG